MRQGGRIMLTACFVLLLLLGAGRLVEGPAAEAAEARPVPPAAQTALLEALVPADTSSGAILEARETAASPMAVMWTVRAVLPQARKTWESNGYPIGSLRWHEAVYAACPPEGWKG